MTTTILDHLLHVTRRYNPFTSREDDGSVVISWPRNSVTCFGLSIAKIADLCDIDEDLFAIVGSTIVLVVPQEIADYRDNDGENSDDDNDPSEPAPDVCRSCRGTGSCDQAGRYVCQSCGGSGQAEDESADDEIDDDEMTPAGRNPPGPHDVGGWIDKAAKLLRS